MLSKKYQSQENVIATYDYTDIAEGTGIQIFHGFTYTSLADISVNVYALGKSTEYSSLIETTFASTATTTKVFDETFDSLSFNTPRTMKGTAQINLGQVSVINVTGTDEQSLVIKIIKVSGGTPAEIVSVTKSMSLATGTHKMVHTIRAVVPATHFKIGDVLRFTIELYSNLEGTGTVTGTNYIGHDPENRDGTGIVPSTDDPRTITMLKFHCPFLIDL